MNKMNRYLMRSVLSGIFMLSGAQAMAKGEPMYDFMPSDTVVDNVKTTLQKNGIDISHIQVEADTQGVVQLTGEADSKQQVEKITRLVQQADGVYAVLGALRYETGEVIARPVPADIDPAMESPAPGNESHNQMGSQ